MIYSISSQLYKYKPQQSRNISYQYNTSYYKIQSAMPRRRDMSDEDEEPQEAEEVREEAELEELPVPQSESEGEDLQENIEQDYQEIDPLDHYESEGIDDDMEHEENPEARRRAERQLNQRDHQLMEVEPDELFFDPSLSLGEADIQRRKAAIYIEEDQEIDEDRFLDVEQAKGNLGLWIRQDQTLKYIKAKFTKFLTHYKGQKQFPIYSTKLRDMCISNKQSLQISYDHLKQALPIIAMWVGLEPTVILPQLNAISYNIACRHYQAFKSIFPEVFVKIRDLPIIDLIRQLRYVHLGKLIKVRGVITIRSEVFSQLKKVMFQCTKCGHEKGSFIVTDNIDFKLGKCDSCQSNGCFILCRQKTIYRNFQKLIIQQSPSQVSAGRIPRSKEIITFGDNIDVARPGEQVQVTGIYMNRYDTSLNIRQGFPLFSTMIEANCMTKVNETKQGQNFDNNIEQQILRYSKKSNIAEIIYNSVAPSIYGHQSIKRALIFSMFSGVEKNIKGTHRIRGDINVLLLGDPGTAKSQFLKSIQKTFHRCVYTTGKGASAVGLTASVKRDNTTGEWRLEAGALVLADRGICLIDEFDKMNDHDRTSIHEAMEQQSISISKAGIVTSLRARCSVIAAANPLQGRYNMQLSFKENVELSDPILSRFDILCVVKDEPNSEVDYSLATFVINSHIENHPYASKYKYKTEKLQNDSMTKESMPAEFLNQYIRYAREKCKPELSSKNHEMIKQFFTNLREEALSSGGMNIAVRHIESIIRISQAHAKMHLRSQVEKRDVEQAISCLLESFIATQKHSVAKSIKRRFDKYLLRH